jgi:hypothetical protein
MDNFLEIAKKRLGQRFVNEIEEQDTLVELISSSGKYRLELLRWVMKEKKVGFIEIRKLSGLEFVKEAPEEGWKILEELIKSTNPDDRDTANEVLQELNDPKSYNLVKTLLNDEYASLQFDACDFLMKIFPEEVVRTLKGLLLHESERVREAAEKKLEMMDRNIY